jgi:hypothetical protein
MKTFKIIALFTFLLLFGSSMTSCAVRLSERHRDNGKHKGWFKNKSHRSHTTYVIKSNHQKHPKATRKVKITNKKKDHWNAKK